MVTIGDFAQTHNLHVKDVIELAQNLGLKFEAAHDVLSDHAKKELMTALNQHLKRLGLKDIKKVTSVVGSDRNKITVVTKKKDVKPFDLQALKNKTKKAAEDLAAASGLQAAAIAQPVLVASTQKEMTQAPTAPVEAVHSHRPARLDKPIVAVDLQAVIAAPAPSATPAKTAEKDANPKFVSKFNDDDDAKSASKVKGKKKKTSNQSSMDIAKIDNHALKKLTSQYQYRDQEEDLSENFTVKKSKKDKKNVHQFNKPVKPVEIVVKLGEFITVTDLASELSVKIVIVIKELLKLGVVAQATAQIDRDMATLVIEELGHRADISAQHNPESHVDIQYHTESEPRSPVVTIMGHVDHGKTSLLDYIRRSRVAASEAGGITQHIGAYRVDTQHGSVTFLDTPGHAAFTAMRARGTKCTDIAVILVAADDGVMPQTKEAVRHAKAAGVPIVVAVNKIDKPGIDLERIKTEMSLLDVLPEEWGGDAPFLGVSAKTGQGVQEFLEALALQAEILELKACVKGPAQGTIIESSLSRHKGPVATVLIQEGTLSVGDMIVCGTHFGRVKALCDDLGLPVISAAPSTPVQVMGLSGVVEAGDQITVVASEKQAREVIEYRIAQYKRQILTTLPVNLENFFSKDQKGKELNIVLKADTQGSVQAIVDSLRQLATEEVSLKIVAQGVGGITESDMMLAKASSAVILAFNTRAEKSAKVIADQDSIAIYYFSIIYELLDHIRSAIYGLESPKFKEEFIGLAEVRSVFRSSILGNIAGCLVMEGHMRKDLPIRVLRKNVVVFQGRLESLRRHKDNVLDVRSGTECGIGVKDYNDIKEGDQIEAYQLVEVQRKKMSN